MEEFDVERSCPVCLWEGDSIKHLQKHMRYMHVDVKDFNLSPFDKFYRVPPEDSDIPCCEICNIFIGFEFVTEHQKNKNHLNNRTLHEESIASVHVNGHELDSSNPPETDAFYDPANSECSQHREDHAGGDDDLESYRDACDFYEEPSNTFTAEDWRFLSSFNPEGERNVGLPQQLSGVGALEAADFSGERSSSSEHIGSTYLSCVQVSTDPAFSMEDNTREILEKRATDWRNWNVVCVANTSVSDEVSVAVVSVYECVCVFVCVFACAFFAHHLNSSHFLSRES